MKRGPSLGRAQGASAVDRARTHWGADLPAEVAALAAACDASTGKAVAATLGYSPALVSHVLANRYPGDMERVFEKIRGALMGATLECPVLGEIGRHRCLDEQRRPFAATNSIRARLYHACRACPNNRSTRGGADERA